MIRAAQANINGCGCEVKQINPPPQKRMNSALHQMMDGRNSEVNVPDQIVQSGNYCYSSKRVASINETSPPRKKKYKQITKDFTIILIKTVRLNCNTLDVGCFC